MKRVTVYIFTASFLLFAQAVVAQEFHVGDISGSNVTHIILDDTMQLYLGGTVAYELDIDQDEIPDIRFTIRHAIGGMATHIWQMAESLNSVKFSCDTSDFNADTLIYMSLIDEELNWISRSGGVRLYEEFYSQAPPPWGPPSYKKGLFRNTDQYLGFCKLSYNDTIYGWINIDASVSQLIFNEFAILRTSYGLQDNDESCRISIYPNPTTGILHVELSRHETRDTKLEIINSSGIVMVRLTQRDFLQQDNTVSININNLPPGLYIIKYATNTITSIQKIIKI